MLHVFLEFIMAIAIPLCDAESMLVRIGLQALAALLKRQARSALNSDVAAIYETNAAQVQILVSKFA
jgi:uncharacterized membrane protein YgcG